MPGGLLSPPPGTAKAHVAVSEAPESSPQSPLPHSGDTNSAKGLGFSTSTTRQLYVISRSRKTVSEGRQRQAPLEWIRLRHLQKGGCGLRDQPDPDVARGGADARTIADAGTGAAPGALGAVAAPVGQAGRSRRMERWPSANRRQPRSIDPQDTATRRSTSPIRLRPPARCV